MTLTLCQKKPSKQIKTFSPFLPLLFEKYYLTKLYFAVLFCFLLTPIHA